MAVAKKKDMDWSYYLNELAKSTTRVSEIERTEFAGYLLRRDMEGNQDRACIFQKIVANDNYLLADLIASLLIAESPDSVEDLLRNIKYIVTENYNDEMNELIIDETRAIEQEKLDDKNRERPCDLDDII